LSCPSNQEESRLPRLRTVALHRDHDLTGYGLAKVLKRLVGFEAPEPEGHANPLEAA
jgi:hypothetical protein